MGILLGPFDPIKLIFGIINTMMSKNLISISEAKSILREALDSNMSEIEKEEFLNSLLNKK